MKVRQYAKNQFVIKDNAGNTFFQSYTSLIAKKTKSGKIYLDRRTWDYSQTTGKYRNKFLGEGIATTRKKIDSGKYKLTNLN